MPQKRSDGVVAGFRRNRLEGLTPDEFFLTCSEKDWQSWVVDYALYNGWWVYHPYNSIRSEPGWPDLTLIRGISLVFAELKTERGRLTPQQRNVMQMLEVAGQEVHLWRPSDRDVVEDRLIRIPSRTKASDESRSAKKVGRSSSLKVESSSTDSVAEPKLFGDS